MITFFNESDINDVAIRLGECQHYSDKISQQILSNNRVSDNLGFFELLKILNKRKDVIVSFYCLKENKQFYIFSDFFNFEEGFSDAFSFFDDMSSVFMMCESKNNCFHISLIKRGEKLFQFVVDIPNHGNVISNAWQEDYKNFFDTVDGLPSVLDIVGSLEYMLEIFCKTDKQMHNYLKENALFVDQYII